MENFKQRILVGVASLAVVGAVVGFSLGSNNDSESNSEQGKEGLILSNTINTPTQTPITGTIENTTSPLTTTIVDTVAVETKVTVPVKTQVPSVAEETTVPETINIPYSTERSGVYNLKGFNYTASDKDFILKDLKFNPENNRLLLYHELAYPQVEGQPKQLAVAKWITITDGNGNEAYNCGYGDMQSSGDGLDLMSKKFTAVIEFGGSIGDVTVEITLP